MSVEQVAKLKQFIQNLHATIQQAQTYLKTQSASPQIDTLKEQVAAKVVGIFFGQTEGLQPELKADWKKAVDLNGEQRNIGTNALVLNQILRRNNKGDSNHKKLVSLETQLQKFVHMDQLEKSVDQLVVEKDINRPTLMGMPYNVVAVQNFPEEGFTVAVFDAPGKHMSVLDIGSQIAYFINERTSAVTISANPYATATIQIKDQVVDLFEKGEVITITGTGPVTGASVVAATYDGKKTREARAQLASGKPARFEDLISPAEVPLDRVLELRAVHKEQLPMRLAA